MLEDLEAFVAEHRAHGPPVGEASELTPSGYGVTVACPCGVVFERWVTDLDAATDPFRPGRN
jgi:hypothetical protein